MPKSLRHTWKKDENFMPDYHFYKSEICKRCGLVKNFGSDKGMHFFICTRSEIVFTINELPECIDWDDNTLN